MNSIDSVFYLTEVFICNTLERRFELTIEDLINSELKELSSRIKGYFSNNNIKKLINFQVTELV